MDYAEIPTSALAIYAHPDDPEISAGGTLARWAQGGAEVWVLICTKGEKGSSDPTEDLDALAERRISETEQACQSLGLAGHVHLTHRDGEIENTLAVRGEIVEHVRRLRPEVIVCPDPTAVIFGDRYVNHADHRATGMAVLDAVSPAAGNPHYFREQLEGGLEAHKVKAVFLSATMEPNCWIDIAATIERKIEALFRHESQLVETGDWFREFLRERAEQAGAEAGLRHAESFRRIVFES